MKQKRYWIAAIIISASAGAIALQNRFAPSLNSDAITDTPASAAVDGQCAYAWAYHDAPGLTKEIEAAVRTVNPAASARAELYGEDCVYNDGRSTFGAMETDFHVRLPADDLANEEALGSWMAQVMPIIAEVPREKIQGNYGFVEFWFEKNDAEHLIVRVPIKRYIDEAQGKTGVELFRIFYLAP